jgi:hypothetical protein
MNKQMTPAETELVQQSFARFAPLSDKAALVSPPPRVVVGHQASSGVIATPKAPFLTPTTINILSIAIVACAIFVVDTQVHVDIDVPVLYVAVVLMSTRLFEGRGITSVPIDLSKQGKSWRRSPITRGDGWQ